MTLTESGSIRREQLLSAAALLFRRRGFDAVGMDDIGSAVGMTGPAVYRHFSSKQTLLAEVISSYLRTLKTERDMLNGRDGGERILNAAIAVGMRLPDRLVTFHRELRSLEPQTLASIEALQRPVTEGWDALLASHGWTPASEQAEVQHRATSGVLLHMTLTHAGTKSVRTAMSETLVTEMLRTPIPLVSSRLDALCPTPIQHVNKREALLEAATVLFQQQGFSRVSLRDIGAVVGLSASAVSRHFESKDQLIEVIVERALSQISASVAAALRMSASGEEASREILRRYVDIALDFRSLISITSTQLYSLAEPQRLMRLRNRRMYIVELAHTLGLARPDLSVPECRLRAGAAYSAINEVVMHPTMWRRDGVADSLVVLSHAVLFA